MRLAAIYNAWDGVELLKGSIDCIKNHVDFIIIVYQNVSNYGEEYSPLKEIDKAVAATEDERAEKGKCKIILEYYEPNLARSGAWNEMAKRNRGLIIARKYSCTHFLHMDCDEYYKDFEYMKEQYINSDREGSVCNILTYFKSPVLRFLNYDNYFVPFIHKLRENSISGLGNYPFYVDPTRRVSCTDVLKIREGAMHHFSYVRKNVERKIRNSSARNNIQKTNILELYNNARAGDFIEPFFGQHLVEVPNYFNINICE
jgi:hypothetical protein